MALRPGGSPPSFAPTATYPAGSDPWSGTPSKVDPGAGLKAQGFTPGQKLPAQFTNWLLNTQGLWLGYQDTLEVRTYTQPTTPQTATPHDLANMLQDNCVVFNAENSKYFAAGQDQTNSDIPLVLRSSNGEQWFSDGAPVITPDGTQQTYQIADSPSDGLFAWVAHGAGQSYARRGSDGVWSALFLLVNGQKTFAARWFIDRWVGVGEVSGPHVGVFTWQPASNTGNTGTLATPALPGASGVTLSGVVAPLICVSPLPLVIVGAPSGAADVWTSPDGVTFTHHANPFAGGAALIFIVWNDGDGLFYAGTIEAGVSKAYTSPDGTTWTLAFTWVGWAWSRSRAQAAIDTSYATGCAVAQGGVAVVQVQRSTLDGAIQTGLAIGRNAGADWDVVTQPNQVATRMGVGSSLSAIQLVGDRVALIREDDVSNNRGGAVSYSLRIG